MADDAAVAGEHRDLEPETPARDRVGVHVQHLEGVPRAFQRERESGDEFVAERAVFARVDAKVRDAPGARQLRRSAGAAAGAGPAAGRRPVAM